MILPKIRDPRFITIRRGGTLTDEYHILLTLWAAKGSEHVLFLFEEAYPDDDRPKKAIEAARKWTRMEVALNEAKRGAWEANNAARGKIGPAKYAALSAGQAAVVPHVAAHELGAAAYALRAIQEAHGKGYCVNDMESECKWQQDQLPMEIKDLVMEDERNRNGICWNVFIV